jgi:hypothetical protein
MERVVLAAAANLARRHDLPLPPDDLVRRVHRIVRSRRLGLTELESFADFADRLSSGTIETSKWTGFIPALAAP